MKTVSPELQEATIMQWTWKTGSMRAMAVAVATIALARDGGEFSALDLPTHGEDAHGGSGIAGTVFGQLAKLGVIAPVGAFIGGEFQQRYVRNACGNRIGVWRLGRAGLARALLRAHGKPVAEPVQEELFNHRGAESAERMPV